MKELALIAGVILVMAIIAGLTGDAPPVSAPASSARIADHDLSVIAPRPVSIERMIDERIDAAITAERRAQENRQRREDAGFWVPAYDLP